MTGPGRYGRRDVGGRVGGGGRAIWRRRTGEHVYACPPIQATLLRVRARVLVTLYS